MSRISGTNFPDGGVTASAYSDSVPYSKTTTELIRTSPSVLHKVSTTLYDGIGRVQQTQLVDPDCGGGTGLVKVDRVYGYNIGAGRYEQTSTPYCNSPGSPYGLLETTNYDALDRATSVLQTDGSSVTTSYSATSAGLLSTVTDEAAKQRKNQTDALGRLTAVWEDPAGLNFETDYSYDALDNLLNVTQKGGTTVTTQWRVRTFTYDSLSRLLSAANPESGTITYSYDNDGNLLSKVAPQPNQTGSATVTTNYTYDAVNRMTKKAYVGMSTAGAQYGYDGLAPAGCTTAPPVLTDSNAIGSRTAMCDASGATSWKHDSMGRVLTESRIVIGTSPWTKSAGYTYNFDGSIATISDPGVGRVMTYTPTAAGRQKSVVNTGGSINFVTNATYAPQGALATYTSGGVVNTTNSYNSRLQPLTLSAATTGGTSILKLTYDFHATTQANNGNVYQIANGRDNNRTQNFLYDSLNRIQQAYTSGTNWGETFGPAATAPGVPPSTSGIDAWGNLTNRSGVAGKTAYEGLTATATTQNQLSGFSYDAAGNMTANSSATYTYDAENRVIGTAGWTYVYDGDGRRVKKFSGSTGTLYWPDLGGNTLNESSLGATNLHEYVYFGGKRVARIDVPTPLTVKYYFSDQLGSADVITDATGNILEESDYFPYGGEIAITNNDGNNYKFTGKERDTESGLDEFGARYYASSLGRFMIPDWAEKPTDVPYASFGNPQSLNLYSYVNNNPTTTRDPDGHVAGADDLVEGAVIGLTITVMATQAYYAMPAQQRNFGAALSGAASSVSSTIRSWFQSSDNSKTAPAPQSNPAPGTQTGSQPGQKDADFVVTPSGTAVATDPGRVRDSLVNAPGVTTTPANSPSGETGTIQTGVKTPNGPVDVRTMDGSASHGPRTVITHPGTNSPKTPDGKATNNKNDNHIPNDHVRPH
jgi:RHS repeat-associated protein